ncbi:hypothetical protein ACLB1N_05420 [Escherichia coli]
MSDAAKILANSPAKYSAAGPGGLQDKPFIPSPDRPDATCRRTPASARVTAWQLCSNRRRKCCQRDWSISFASMVLLAHQHVSQMRFTKKARKRQGACITQSAFLQIFMLNAVLARNSRCK